jgi:hypothetical protein
VAEITWRVLVFGCPDRGLAPFAVWEAARDGVTAAGASPEQARKRLDAAIAAEEG